MGIGATGIVNVGIPVTDQDKALDFYVGKLGLQKRVDQVIEKAGMRWVEVAPAGSPTSIALMVAHEGVPAGVETGVHLTVTDAAAAHADMVEQGIDVDELLLWEGAPPMFTFRDQDGNGLDIVQ